MAKKRKANAAPRNRLSGNGKKPQNRGVSGTGAKPKADSGRSGKKPPSAAVVPPLRDRWSSARLNSKTPSSAGLNPPRKYPAFAFRGRAVSPIIKITADIGLKKAPDGEGGPPILVGSAVGLTKRDTTKTEK